MKRVTGRDALKKTKKNVKKLFSDAVDAQDTAILNDFLQKPEFSLLIQLYDTLSPNQHDDPAFIQSARDALKQQHNGVPEYDLHDEEDGCGMECLHQRILDHAMRAVTASGGGDNDDVDNNKKQLGELIQLLTAPHVRSLVKCLQDVFSRHYDPAARQLEKSAKLLRSNQNLAGGPLEHAEPSHVYKAASSSSMQKLPKITTTAAAAPTATATTQQDSGDRIEPAGELVMVAIRRDPGESLGITFAERTFLSTSGAGPAHSRSNSMKSSNASIDRLSSASSLAGGGGGGGVVETFREVVVTRVLAESRVAQRGLLNVGDIITEVNGVEVTGAEQLQKQIRAVRGLVTLKVVPFRPRGPNASANPVAAAAASTTNGASPQLLANHKQLQQQQQDLQLFLRAQFSYNPNCDALIPSKEAGLHFQIGDVLQIFDQSDPHWWQAKLFHSATQKNSKQAGRGGADGGGPTYAALKPSSSSRDRHDDDDDDDDDEDDRDDFRDHSKRRKQKQRNDNDDDDDDEEEDNDLDELEDNDLDRTRSGKKESARVRRERAGLIPSPQLQERRLAFNQSAPDPDKITYRLFGGGEGGGGGGGGGAAGGGGGPGKKHLRGLGGGGHSSVSKTKTGFRSMLADQFLHNDLVVYEEVAQIAPFQRKLICLIGALGVGRTTMRDMLFRQFPDTYAQAIPHTTREQKAGERHGDRYLFELDKAQMQSDVARGDVYVEVGELHGELYGIKLDTIRQVVSQGRTCVLDCSPATVTRLRGREFMPYVIMLASPTVECMRAMYEFGRSQLKTEKLKRYEDFHRSVEESIAMERQWRHVIDSVLVVDHMENSYCQLVEQLNALRTEPQWVPASWIY